MISYANDPTIRFDHTPVVNKIAFQIRQVGPDDPYVFDEKNYTDTDDNTIYVSSESPGDDSNPGTEASPKATLLAAINATTAVKTKVIILNEDIYNEDISGGTYTYLQGIYNDTGQASSWVGRQLGFTPSDSNAVFVAKTGSDSTGTAGTQADPWLTITAAIADCDTGRDVVVILDSGTYEEEGFEFTGNFTGLYAAIGCTPIVTLTNPNIAVGVFEEVTVDGVGNYSLPTTFPYNAAPMDKALQTNDGDVIMGYRDSSLLKYKIVDKAGSSVLAATTVSGGDIYGYQMALMENGNIVFAYRRTSDNSYYFRIMSQAGAGVTAETNMAGNTWGGTEYFALSKLYDNGFVVAYTDASDSNKGKAKIYSNEGALVTTITFDTTSGAAYYRVFALKTVGRFVTVSQGGGATNKGYYSVWSNTGTEIKAQTLVYGPIYSLHVIEMPCGTSLNNGDFCIAWREGLSGATYEDEPFYGIWDSDGTVIKSPDLVHDFTNIDYIDAFRTSNDILVIALVQHADTDRVEFAYYDNQGVFDSHETAYSASPDTSAVALQSRQDNACCIYQKKSGSLICQHTFFSELLFYAMTNSVAGGIIINGVTFDQDGIGGLYCFIYSTNPMELSWCEFMNGTPDTITASGYVVAGGELTTMQYCKCHDCNNGIVNSLATFSIIYSQFYRITLGYALYNDVAAAGAGTILVEHCDFFNNYGGIHFENNDANSSVLNCILHDNSVYDIDAEVAMTLTYSVASSGCTTTVTYGTSTTRANPLYVNEGYVNPADTDLNLRVKVIGYPSNSSAYSLADDNYNAGSLLVKYIGADTSYTSITVPKPNDIKITYQYAGGVTTQKRDGSYSSYRDGMSEIVTMTWAGIAAAYMSQLLVMWKSSERLVNIYPDPVTYPTQYEQWSIVRDPMEGGAVSPTLSDIGAQGVQLKFAKAVS